MQLWGSNQWFHISFISRRSNCAKVSKGRHDVDRVHEGSQWFLHQHLHASKTVCINHPQMWNNQSQRILPKVQRPIGHRLHSQIKNRIQESSAPQSLCHQRLDTTSWVWSEHCWWKWCSRMDTWNNCSELSTLWTWKHVIRRRQISFWLQTSTAGFP